MPTASARFHLISGNRLDLLAAHLGLRLATPADPDSLAPDVVLIPQPALRHWLQQALAERYGVAANLDICTPSEFVWRLLRSAHPQLPDTSPWDRASLRWQLYALLDDSAAALSPAVLPSAVRQHLQRAAGASADIGAHAHARYGLADALAGAYDKYQAYRRDWLQAWERNDPPSRDDWQAQLWRALRQRLRGTPHRAALIGDWLARHDRDADTFAGHAPPGLPPRVAAFGTIHVSPDVLHLLAVVGQWSELDFYLPSPSAEYWGDVESLRARLRRDGVASLPTALADAERDNPLLTAWGAGGREILAQLFSYDIVLPQRETELFALPGRDTLLHRLQHDVLDRAAPIIEPCVLDDVSLQLHACHSKLREVEVLHDQLRALLDDARFDPPLQPREIAVLTPDIADYLPLARAVFGGLAPDDARYIPFSLADRPQAQSHPLIGLLLDLLTLADTPLTASAFRDLLATPGIAHALQLDAAQRAKIDAWFEAAGIRWGEDEAARERAGAGRWREYSFDFGIDRLLSGYAVGAGTADIAIGAGSAEHIAPYAELEGADAETLDRALSVYRQLRTLIAWMRTPHSAGDWRARLADTLQALLAPVPQDDSEAQARRLLLETLDDFASEAANAGALPATLVQRTLRDTLTLPSPHRPWLSGGVTFAGMVPLRTVPFRVICLLGLDADAYPRREPGDDINRIVDAIQGRAPRRLGDRSVRDDDRFLFLQLLCAAGDVFYLSYGGRDARDGSVREPSPVIAELLDAVERMHGGVHGEQVRESLCVHHPLQPFSPRAFGAGDHGGIEPRRFSYRKEWAMPAAAAVQMIEPPFIATPLASTTSDDAPAAPDRDALQRFFVNPARDWLRESVGLRLPDAARAAIDREPQGENGLLRYSAIEALLRHDDDTERVEPWLRAQALLPPGRDGGVIAQDARDIAARLLTARAIAVGTAHPHIVAANVTQTPHGIAFRFDDVHDDARAIVVAGRLDGKRRLRAGLDHLLLASLIGEHARTHLIGYDGKANAPVEIIYTGRSQDDAYVKLGALLALWQEGQHTPLPFAPKAAFAYAEHWHAKNDASAAWKSALGAFSPYTGGGENEDAWMRLAFRPDGLLNRFDAPHAQRFREIAVIVFDAQEPGA